jgi:hypothetical protein
MTTKRDTAALKACVRYDRAATELRDATRAINDALERCPISAESYRRPRTDRAFFDENGRVRHHMHIAMTEGVWPTESTLRNPTTDEITARLSDPDTGCPHCLRAWQLVQHRKALRQQIGVAKRAIRRAAKAATTDPTPKRRTAPKPAQRRNRTEARHD